ncbi:hypothetical protein QJS66_21885 [Kocuria rhizophila]|nr:hypothetical protein QJS66_21885 [Kocuria rhizophila]
MAFDIGGLIRRRDHHGTVFAFTGMDSCSSMLCATRQSQPGDGRLPLPIPASSPWSSTDCDLVYSATDPRAEGPKS